MTDQPLRVRTECYAGYRSEETPRRFFLGARAVEVVDVLDRWLKPQIESAARNVHQLLPFHDRWLSPEHRYFKLRGDDGGVYILRHSVVDGYWELTLYDSGGAGATRLSST